MDIRRTPKFTNSVINFQVKTVKNSTSLFDWIQYAPTDPDQRKVLHNELLQIDEDDFVRKLGQLVSVFCLS